MGSSRGIDPIMFLIRLGHMYSAVHTSAFIMLKPNSDQYLAIDNYYPLHDNVSFSNNPNNFVVCNEYSVVTYKAGIYEWGTELRPVYQMMDPLPPPVFVIPGMK
ncbi:unnamed protein product, partial [Rotaria sp. Silwood1]